MGCVYHSIYMDGIVILSIEVELCEGTGSREVLSPVVNFL